MTIKTQALRFRIWQYANPKGWDVTFSEVAAALGVDARSIGAIARHAGWVERFRVSNKEAHRQMRQDGALRVTEMNNLAVEIASGRVGVDA